MYETYYTVLDGAGNEVCGADTLADLVRVLSGCAAAERAEAERRRAAEQSGAVGRAKPECYGSVWSEFYGEGV